MAEAKVGKPQTMNKEISKIPVSHFIFFFIISFSF